MKSKVLSFLALQSMSILFSLAGLAVKLTSNSWRENGILATSTLTGVCVFTVILATYAFFWQKVIKKFPLSTAYLSKGSTLFWSMLWAVVIVGESLTFANVLGTVMILSGAILILGNKE